MSNENADTERPRPEGETLIEMKRSAGHAALQALETVATGAEYGVGLYVGKEAVAPVVAKVKDALKPKDSTIELPPGVDRPD